MTFNTITNSIKNKIENIQKADQKKNLKIKDITLISEFEKLLAMDDSVVNAMTESMKTEGFKPGHELHVWAHDGKFILTQDKMVSFASDCSQENLHAICDFVEEFRY